MSEAERGLMIGRALDALEWVGDRRAPFRAWQLAAALEVNLRTAYRWLGCLESRGIVKRSPGQRWERA